MPVNTSGGQAPKPPLNARLTTGIRSHQSVRQFTSTEFLAAIFDGLPADDGVVFITRGQHVWFPSYDSRELKSFLANAEKGTYVSLVSLNELVFGFSLGKDALEIEPSIFLKASGLLWENIYLFDRPIRTDDPLALKLAEFVDIETPAEIAGLYGWRREWHRDSGTTYAIADLLNALAKRALADEASKDASNV